MTATPNHALQRTAPAVTLAASTAALPPTMQPARQPPQSLSFKSLGRHAITPQEAEAITRILRERCGRWTLVDLRDGQQFRVFDIAWGRDMGVEFDHITTNISPGPSGEHAVDFFLTSEVVGVSDPSTGQSLLPTSAA